MALLHFSELRLLEFDVEYPGGSEGIDGWHLLSRSGESGVVLLGLISGTHNGSH